MTGEQPTPRRPRALAALLAALVAPAAPAAIEESVAEAATTAPDDLDDPAAVRTLRRATAVGQRAAAFRQMLVRVRRGGRVRVFDRPGGEPVAVLDGTTEFGSPEVLPVVQRRGRWLGVLSTHRPNRRLGWIRAGDRDLKVEVTEVKVEVDRSERVLRVHRDGGLLARTRVAVGAAGSRTPLGRFAVTDKLRGSRFSDYYGCCIIALSGHQPSTPVGWTGGDRLAIHGSASGQVAGASTAGCVRGPEGKLRKLMLRVPLGAVVTVRR